MPHTLPFFNYTVIGYVQPGNYMGRSNFKVQKTRWELKKKYVEAKKFEKIFLLEVKDKQKIQISDENEFLAKHRNLSRTMTDYIKDIKVNIDGEEYYSMIDFIDIFSSEQGRSVIKDNKNILDFRWKLLFLYDELKILIQPSDKWEDPLYSESVIFKLSWDDIISLHDQVISNPFPLCFNPLISFNSKLIKMSEESNENSLDQIGLSELTHKDLVDLTKRFEKTCKIEDWFFTAVKLYIILKEWTFNNGHAYISRNALAYTIRNDVNNAKHFEQSMKWMKMNNIINEDKLYNKYKNIQNSNDIEDTAIYLHNIYTWELCTVEIFRLMFKNHIDVNKKKEKKKNIISNKGNDKINQKQQQQQNIETLVTKSEVPKKRQLTFEEEIEKFNQNTSDPIKTINNHELCSEQKAAMKIYCEKPVLLVEGRAGSGKTEFLSILLKFHKIDHIIGTAFQANHVENLSRIFPNRCFTTHLLLYTHNNTCYNYGKNASRINTLKKTSDDDNNNNDDNNGKKEYEFSRCGLKYHKCIFENIEILLIDEMSTQSIDVFSKIISAVFLCGKLKRLILIGDHHQLISIRPGDVLHQLYKVLSENNMAVEFLHNHRVKESARILHHNSEAIRMGEAENLIFDNKNCIMVDLKSFGGIENSLDHVLRKYKIEEEQHCVITRTNNIKKILNKVTEEYFHNFDNIQSKTPYLHYRYEPNRKIMFKKNDYTRGLFNNQILCLDKLIDFSINIPIEMVLDKHRTASVYKSFPKNTGEFVKRENQRVAICHTLLTNEKKNFIWDKWAQRYVRHASAITTHGFQGSQINTIIIVIPFFSQFDTREALYTAFTRAVENVIIIGKKDDIFKIIKNIEPIRDSYLSSKIREHCVPILDLKKKKKEDGTKKNNQIKNQFILV